MIDTFVGIAFCCKRAEIRSGGEEGDEAKHTRAQKRKNALLQVLTLDMLLERKGNERKNKSNDVLASLMQLPTNLIIASPFGAVVVVVVWWTRTIVKP